MKLVPIGNSHERFCEGGLKTHIGDFDEYSGKALCGIDASLFDEPDRGIDLRWIETGGAELCKKCARIARPLLRQGAE